MKHLQFLQQNGLESEEPPRTPIHASAPGLSVPTIAHTFALQVIAICAELERETPAQKRLDSTEMKVELAGCPNTTYKCSCHTKGAMLSLENDGNGFMRLRGRASRLRARSRDSHFWDAMKPMSKTDLLKGLDFSRKVARLDEEERVIDDEVAKGNTVVYMCHESIDKLNDATDDNIDGILDDLRLGDISFDGHGIAFIESGPYRNSPIRPSATIVGRPPKQCAGMCEKCRVIFPVSDIVVCIKCRSSMLCKQCARCDKDHACKGEDDVDYTVRKLRETPSYPFFRMISPLGQKNGDGEHFQSVAISVLDAIRGQILPTDIAAGLDERAKKTLLYRKNEVSSRLLPYLAKP